MNPAALTQMRKTLPSLLQVTIISKARKLLENHISTLKMLHFQSKTNSMKKTESQWSLQTITVSRTDACHHWVLLSTLVASQELIIYRIIGHLGFRQGLMKGWITSKSQNRRWMLTHNRTEAENQILSIKLNSKAQRRREVWPLKRAMALEAAASMRM